MSLAAVVMSAVAVWVPAPEVKHRHRHKHKPAPAMRSALASWYDLHGGGACGVDDVQNGYRFASLILGCGTRIRICRGRRCVTARMADHGPYVSGRTFDLNVNLRDALACSGLCSVRWRIAR
jgi:rare lipoprotein A (peptidoglycan hydrolase)